MNLYKYRGNSPKTDLILTNREVWLPRSRDLNDPCECSMLELAPDWMEDKIREMKQAQMEGALLFNGRKNRPFLKEIRATLPSIPDFDQKYKTFCDIYKKHFVLQLSRPDQLFSKLDKQLNSVGVFSLSGKPDHPLMWSHYAEEHRGICLGFELRDLTPSTDPQRFSEAKYFKDRDSLTWVRRVYSGDRLLCPRRWKAARRVLDFPQRHSRPRCNLDKIEVLGI